jgi:hypothetical protein
LTLLDVLEVLGGRPKDDFVDVDVGGLAERKATIRA